MVAQINLHYMQCTVDMADMTGTADMVDTADIIPRSAGLTGMDIPSVTIAVMATIHSWDTEHTAMVSTAING
ncbi:MAG: hypothetical protein N3B21_07835 [Clostridia bacterium]|nr:hypothetical protein [Clostridia bacterium]